MLKSFKSHFRFNKQERNGVFFLLLLIILLQSVYFLVKFSTSPSGQKVILDNVAQRQIDSLKQIALLNNAPKIYPFNPNFISDYKGYTLGMSAQEINRLLQFRESGKYVNSALEFQEVTQVSDSLLSTISTYFKFPQWSQKQSKTKKSSINKILQWKGMSGVD